MLCRAVRTEQHHSRIGASRIAFIGVLALTLLGARTLAAQEEAPHAHTVKRGDTLWDLAKLYLGDSFLWPEIYRLNTDVIDDPHWIYPGEVLKLPTPGATPTVAEAPPVKQAGEPVPTTPVPPPAAATPPTATGTPVYEPPIGILDGPTVFPKDRLMTVSKQRAYSQPPLPTVKLGTFVSAPFVDRSGGPKGSGQILKVISLSVTASGRDPKERAQLHDELLISPPVGSAASEGDRYVAYTFGPYVDDLGQVVIPTGIVEVTRAPRDREATTVQVIRMFGEIQTDQHLMPYDSTALHVFGRPEPMTDSIVATVKLVNGSPILPTLDDFVMVDVTARDGIRLGDEFVLFVPRHKSEVSGAPADPEMVVARAQAVRVTSYGTTLMILGERHTKIEAGTLARRIASMR